VRSYQNGFEVDFPDGSVLWTLSVGEWGINAVLQPSDALRAGGTGLLGPITPGGMGVPALPDGTQLPAAPDKHTRFVTLYGQFADAWRVTDASSLFDYDAGTSTATFTDRSFPTEQQALALESFPPDQSAAGETACAAVSDADLHRDGDYPVRQAAQQARLGLPPLPTTTIGSFPQTAEIRDARRRWRCGELDAEAYDVRTAPAARADLSEEGVPA
jgi:hypothetical protein